MLLNKSEHGGGPGFATSVECEITDGFRVSPPINPTKGNDLRRKTSETMKRLHACVEYVT